MKPASPESRERFPRNLLTHKDETIAAMAEIEGPNWRRDSENDPPDEYNISGALRWLSKKPDPEGLHFVIYGSGGYNRWFTMPNGDVKLSKGHAGEKDIERAQTLGFEIW